MKKGSINMFQVPPLMVYEYEGDMNKILEYTSNIEFMEGGFSRSTNDYILDNDNLKELKQFCLDSVHDYVDDIMGINDEIEIQQSWVNKNSPGENHPEHYHPNSFISGVFYVESDPIKGSPITFKSELHKSNFSVQKLPHSYMTALQSGEQDKPLKYYPCTANSYNYPSIPGQLILFSSMTSHVVPVNLSDKNRISLSFNTYPKLPFGERNGLTYLR